MTKLLLTLSSLVVMTACSDGHSGNRQKRTIKHECLKGEMKAALNVEGENEIAPRLEGLSPEFLILADTGFKAGNFVSFHEKHYREKAVTLDTSDLDWLENWNELTVRQKFAKVKEEKKLYLIEADSEHFKNNNERQLVWIINNSIDTVAIQRQDWNYICILQAQNEDGQWYPIQNWNFSRCGNSYYIDSIPPGSSKAFITELPKDGDFQTKLRFKLLGADKFYYSNEFDGKINYCMFKDSPAKYKFMGKLNRSSYFKLDSFVNLVPGRYANSK